MQSKNDSAVDRDEPISADELISADDPAIIAKYEPYLRMLARTQQRRAYQAKVGASDVVQQVMLQAVQGFDGFNGSTEPELRGWLRRILSNHLCHLDRDLHRDKRDIRREQSMEQRLAKSSLRLEALLAGDGPTPSENCLRDESVLALVDAVEVLPEDQREAVRLHYLCGEKLGEVAQRMGKSTGSVAGLLHRGMQAIRQNLRPER